MSDTARAEEAERLSQQGSWFLFNDSDVSASSFHTLVNITNNFPSDVPYILLYRRVTEQDILEFQSELFVVAVVVVVVVVVAVVVVVDECHLNFTHTNN